MKLNKSVLGLVIGAIFILSSCSQARYGTMTRRVKTHKVDQQKVVVDKSKKESGLILSKANTQNATPEETVAVEKSKQTAVTTTDSDTYTKEAEVSTSTRKKRSGKDARKLRSVEKILLKVPGANKAVLKLKDMKELNAPKSADSGDVESILYIVLIVLLVLLILSLISSVLPALRWLLGLALLVLLIYILLQLI